MYVYRILLSLQWNLKPKLFNLPIHFEVSDYSKNCYIILIKRTYVYRYYVFTVFPENWKLIVFILIIPCHKRHKTSLQSPRTVWSNILSLSRVLMLFLLGSSSASNPTAHACTKHIFINERKRWLSIKPTGMSKDKCDRGKNTQMGSTNFHID